MRTSLSLSLLALVGTSAAQVNTTFLATLAAALNDAGLTSLATVAGTVANTTQGAALINSLQNGTYTVFAPSNDAFDAVPDDVSSNDDLLASILSYHILPGNYTGETANAPNHTIGRTLLSDPDFVNLEGGKRQVLSWTRNNGDITILNQGTANNVTVGTTATVGNLFVAVIPRVLSIPPSLYDLLTSPAGANLTGITTILQAVPALPPTSTSTSASASASASAEPNLAQVLGGVRGFTFFAPNNAGLEAAQSALQSLQSNTSALQTVLRNHLINGTSVYSPSLLPPNASAPVNLTSAAGERLSFNTNSTGLYVTSGSSQARIMQSDLLVGNGVVHIIDGVLANTAVNEGAASSAYESATSAAGAATATETAPVGITTTQAAGDASGNGGSGDGSGTGNGAVGVGAGLLGVLGSMVLGAGMVLM